MAQRQSSVSSVGIVCDIFELIVSFTEKKMPKKDFLKTKGLKSTFFNYMKISLLIYLYLSIYPFEGPIIFFLSFSV